MGRWIAVLMVTLGLWASPPAARAADADSPVLSRIVSGGTLRVGMSGAQPPLNFESKGGELMGVEVDLARALAGMMGVDLEIVKKPFSELLGALAAGKLDLVMSGMTITPARSLKASFVGPYFLSGKSILTRSSTLAQADEAGDLDQKDLKLAALAGSTSQAFVETRLPKAELVSTPNSDKAVELLLAGEVDALVADREIVALTSFLNPKEGLVSLREPLTIEPIGIAVPSGDPQLVNLLENTLGALEASGLMSAVRARWLERNDWVQQLP